LSFTGEQIGFANSAHTASFTTVATAAAAATAITASVNGDSTLRSSGVFAIQTKADGSSVSFVSLKAFNLTIGSTAGLANGTNNIDALQTPTAATAGVLTGGESGAQTALAAIKAAIGTLGSVQGKVGAGQNNLEQAIELASNQIVNFQAAESSIRDADVAAEASNMSRLNTLQQAGVAALAQANQSSQALLSLLR
jgi:flagellin